MVEEDQSAPGGASAVVEVVRLAAVAVSEGGRRVCEEVVLSTVQYVHPQGVGASRRSKRKAAADGCFSRHTRIHAAESAATARSCGDQGEDGAAARRTRSVYRAWSRRNLKAVTVLLHKKTKL